MKASQNSQTRKMMECRWQSLFRFSELAIILVLLARLLYRYVSRMQSALSIKAQHEAVTSEKHKSLKTIPSAPWIPILGSLPFLGQYPPRQMAKWGREGGYGSVFRVRFGPKSVLILNDLEAIRDGFLRNGNRISGRWQTPVLEEMTMGHGIIFIDLNTAKGRKQKNFGHSAFRKISMNEKIDRIIGAEALTASEAILRQISGDDNGEHYIWGNYRRSLVHSANKSYVCGFDGNDAWKTMSPESLIHKFMTNVMCNLLFGRSFGKDETEYNYVLEETPVQARKSFASFMLVFLVPSLRQMPLIKGVIDEALCLRKATLKMIREITDEHIKNFSGLREDADFIDCFLSEMFGKEHPKEYEFTYEQLLTYVFDIYTAGAETTADTMVWGLLYLARDPKLQNEIRDEILAVAGGEDYFPSSTEIARMHLVRATIHELLRIRPIATLAMPHRATVSCEVNGFEVPKDSVVMANIWSVHHNPEVFPDPEKFDPRRHINPAGEFVPSKHMISFSLGPRRCLGRRIAETGMLFMISTLVRKFEFRLPKVWDGARNGFVTVEPNMKGTEGQVLLPPEYVLEWRKFE